MSFSKLSSYLSTKATFTPADLNAVEQVCIYRSLAAGEKLVVPGDLWQYNAFVANGLAREYLIDVWGNEKTILFAPENHWTGDRESSLTGNPATLYVEAIVPTDFILIQRDDFEKLCISLAPFSDFMDNLIQRNINARAKHLQNQLYTDEQKIEAFKAKYPTVGHRAPLHIIATYLEMDEATLKKYL